MMPPVDEPREYTQDEINRQCAFVAKKNDLSQCVEPVLIIANL